MKVLKIESGKGYYLKEDGEYNEVSEVSKDDLLKMLDLFLMEDCEMDEYNEAFLKNKAHQIIYSNLYSKFKELEVNKNHFELMVDNTYKDALDKYSEQ